LGRDGTPKTRKKTKTSKIVGPGLQEMGKKTVS